MRTKKKERDRQTHSMPGGALYQPTTYTHTKVYRDKETRKKEQRTSIISFHFLCFFCSRKKNSLA